MRLVGFVGFKGSGKNTASLPLLKNNFVGLSFAEALKDALSVMFHWERHLLEGDTPEGRLWREKVDLWWSKKLGIPDFSPRKAMTMVGTEAIRRHFHEDIWVLNVERRIDIEFEKGHNVALTDIRFPNEHALARNKGGSVYWIKKGPDPEWIDIAIASNKGDMQAKAFMEASDVHETEYAWLGLPVDSIIENNSTIEELSNTVLLSVLS